VAHPPGEARAHDRFLDPAPFPDAPPGFVVRAILALRRRLQRAADAVVPAEVLLIERATGAVDTACVGLAARLGVSDLLEAAGPLTAEEIARRLGTRPDETHRFLRLLAAHGIYELDAEGRFTNNRTSRALLSSAPTRGRSWAQYFASPSNLAAWGQLETAVRTGARAFVTAHGMGVWRWFEAHPDEREQFAHAMMGLTFLDAPVIASSYPFAEVQILCDVGGGRGSLLSELLVRHPHLRGMLCDAAGVLDSAQSLLAARGVADRVELVPTDFFASVPTGADTYLLKNILHDWDDAACGTILGHVRRAISPAGRLLLVEAVCERNDTESFAPIVDVQMMVACDGGRERSRAEFERLLSANGFELRRVFPYPTTSILEARPI
jgi:hypothetical protein